MWNNKPNSQLLIDSNGFALPSILLLVTILSLVAASIITLQYLSKEIVVSDLAKVKCENAAESGIAVLCSHLRTSDDIAKAARGFEEHTDFVDESSADVRIQSWGVYFLLRSTGKSGKFQTTRFAIVADRPSDLFSNALVFANPSHQLVMTGLSSIEGNVIVGTPGVTIGNLRNYSSPLTIPIKGNVSREQNLTMPQVVLPQLDYEVSFYKGLIAKTSGDIPSGDAHTVKFSNKSAFNLRTSMIPDSVGGVLIEGNAALSDTLIREKSPLIIVATGSMILRKGSRIAGPVTVVSSSNLLVEDGAFFDESILYSQDSIDVHSQASSGQLIASSIRLHSGTHLEYPSALVSFSIGATLGQKISLENGAILDGFIMLASTSDDPGVEHLITIDPGAKVTGGVFTNAKLTLDGTVVGTVVTKDFYFYEAPTTYLGWLRGGRIDRKSLPSGFMLPPGLSSDVKLDVLDWL